MKDEVEISKAVSMEKEACARRARPLQLERGGGGEELQFPEKHFLLASVSCPEGKPQAPGSQPAYIQPPASSRQLSRCR